MEILLDASAILAVIANKPETTPANEVIGKSPLADIPRISLPISTQEIVTILQECRAGMPIGNQGETNA
jgi:predicted nucleic acid-binding protein